MVVETMAEQEFCNSCDNKRLCPATARSFAETSQDLYRNPRSDKGTFLVRRVLAAFVLPIIVFIAALAISEKALATAIESVHARTVAGLAIAVLAVFACILITKLIRDKHL